MTKLSPSNKFLLITDEIIYILKYVSSGNLFGTHISKVGLYLMI